MAVCVSSIDWRDEFAALEPYINGKGGIVRIRYAGHHGAHNTFIQALKSGYECEDGDKIRRTILIDKNNYATRYLPGIRDVFIRKMRMELPSAHSAPETPVLLNIANEIEAGTHVDIDIKNVTSEIYYNGDNPVLMTSNRNEWIDDLCKKVHAFLDTGHIMLVISHGRAKDQDEFWSCLWNDALESCIDNGLLLIHMVDISDEAAGMHERAPNPNLEISLPIALSPQAQIQAIEDLTEIMLSKIPSMSRNEALTRAETLVGSNINDIPRLHSEGLAFVLTLAQEAENP